MKVLFISNLFPDQRESYRGLDNACVLHHLGAHCKIRVLSPRPTLPLRGSPRTCRAEDALFQPEFPAARYVPKIGSRFNHRLFAAALREPMRRLRESFPFEVILCAWAYPDGCAVAKLAEEFRVPFVCVVQGSDAHAYLEMPVRRRLIVSAMNQAGAVVTRSADIAQRLKEAGVESARLHPVYNGVDQAVFKPADARAARLELGLPHEAQIVLYVGNFLPIKNPLLLLEAHSQLCRTIHRPCHLVLIGGGPLEPQMRAAVKRHGNSQFVHFAGRKNPTDVARYMQAADVLCLSSDNEGVPNVILEAFACGLRVVSTDVGGIAEVLNQPCLGELVKQRKAETLAAALQHLLAVPAEQGKILEHARNFTWQKAAERYLALLRKAVGNDRGTTKAGA